MAETYDLKLCCKLRAKILLAPAIVPKELCGISDAEMADVMTFEKSPHGRQLIAFRFCPWCGKPWEQTGRVVERAPDEIKDEERERMKCVARGYEALIAGCMRDLGVTREAAQAIASRSIRWLHESEDDK